MNPTPVRHRLGRRGAFLLTGGIVWILEALWLIRHHQPVPGVWLLSHGWVLQSVAWGVTWVWTANTLAVFKAQASIAA